MPEKPVRDDLFRPAKSTHQFPKEFQWSLLIPALGNDGLEDFTLTIDSTKERVAFALDRLEQFVDMEGPKREDTQMIDTFPPDLGCKRRAEAIPPETNGFVTDIDPALGQQVFDVPQRQWEAEMYHPRQADDLGAGLEVAEGRVRSLPEAIDCEIDAQIEKLERTKLVKERTAPHQPQT